MNLTVQDVHDCMNAINRGRLAIGEPALSTVEFDESEPNNGYNCLSARHLFVRASDESVGPSVAYTRNALVLQETFGTGGVIDLETGGLKHGALPIPEEILKVTETFDAAADSPELLPELRSLFVEAGYIQPDD